MAANWSPVHGWSEPLQLSGPRERPYIPTIVSNRAGQVAVAWISHPRNFDHPESAVVAVRRGGTRQRTRVGPSAFNGTPSQVGLGMAADGAVTVAWEDMVDPTKFPGLRASTPCREHHLGTHNRFGSAGSLAVQPDGSSALDTIDHLFTRVGQGDWTDQGRPSFHVGAAPQTMPSGALFGWGTHIYLDPDGIAGPIPGTDIGSAPNGGQPFATTENTLVPVSGHGHNVTISTWTQANGWSDVQVVYTDPHRWIVNPLTANMTLDGQVTALLRTRPAGSGSHHPLDLEVIRFDATPTTP